MDANTTVINPLNDTTKALQLSQPIPTVRKLYPIVVISFQISIFNISGSKEDSGDFFV